MPDIQEKCITKLDYKNFTKEIFGAKIKEKGLVDKSDISNLVKIFDLNTKFATLTAKAELKSEQDKIVKFEAFDSSYYCGKFISWISKYVCLSTKQTYNTLELNKDKSTGYVIGWKWKGLFKSKFLPLHGALLPNVKYFGYKIRIQFNDTPLVFEQNNYTTKTVNAYIVYD